MNYKIGDMVIFNSGKPDGNLSIGIIEKYQDIKLDTLYFEDNKMNIETEPGKGIIFKINKKDVMGGNSYVNTYFTEDDIVCKLPMDVQSKCEKYFKG